VCRALREAGFPENLDADDVEAILQRFEVSLMEPEYHGLGELDAAWMACMSHRAMDISELGEVIVTELDAGGTLPWMVMKGPLPPDSGGEGRNAQNER